MTLGIFLDRSFSIIFLVSLIVAVAGLTAWAILFVGRHQGTPVFLWLACAALASGYHNWWRDSFPADDIGNFVTPEQQPGELRGFLEEEPYLALQATDPSLFTLPRGDTTLSVLRVTQLRQGNDWLPVSGRVRLSVHGRLEGIHVGDEVQVVGRSSAPHGPSNPGERDSSEHLRDQRIRAVLAVHKTTDGVVRIGERSLASPRAWLAWLRAHFRRVLEERLPKEQQGLAIALLLGDGSTLTAADWDRYMRTGVVHVAIVSGQHLAILGGFLWFVLRRMGLRQRRGAVIVAAFLLGYALMVGARPPVMRAAVMAVAVCGGVLLRRPVMPANIFALAWIVIGLINPTDLFDPGCQLSFLCVALLYWGGLHFFFTKPPEDPLDRLIEKARPPWQRRGLWLLRFLGRTFALSFLFWLGVAPLVAARYNTVSPAAAILMPLLALLESVALVSGFLLLLLSPLGPLTWPFAFVTRLSLTACDVLINLTDGIPGGHWYVGQVPGWWIGVFYVGLLAVLILQSARARWRWFAFAGLLWLCVGLVGAGSQHSTEELRVTFLAVGHGGCTVIETPDGRVLLYDAGAMGGPEVATRQVAPYLWSRNLRRIDEVFLSHADLDHFNGLPALLDRFAVGQITCTPTFADKHTAGVEQTLAEIARLRIPVRIVKAGDRLDAGPVAIEVLHPPAVGPEGNENARSMVLLVTHAGHSLLLTGDLEGPGLAQVLSRPAEPVDVLMAPHHGSRLTNTPELAAWASPRVVISSQGFPRSPADVEKPYRDHGAQFLRTWDRGAVTVRSHSSGLVIETFRDGERIALRTGKN
jgi:competence protein ComEC